MTSQAIKLKVTASVPKDCIFELQDDGWNGVCEDLSVTVRGVVSRMRRGKWKKHSQAHISVLREHSRTSHKKVARDR